MADDRQQPKRDLVAPFALARNQHIRDLTAELAALARSNPEAVVARLAGLELRDQAEIALGLPAAERLEVLLHAPKRMTLVRAVPDTDFYLTVREVGPTDALPLVALASPEQLQHLVDLESWRRDRFDADRAGAWAALLLEAGEPTIRRFLRGSDDELLVLLFQKWMRISQIEYEDTADVHGHGEGEAGTDLGIVTPDGYHRFSPTIAEHATAIRMILQVFFLDQPERYQRLLWEALWSLPSEVEEQALHWRQSRLHEHGFPAWDEALQIYAPPEGSRVHPEPPAATERETLRAPRQPMRVLGSRDPIGAAIARLPDPVRERVLHELVSLSNHLIVADNEDTGDPASHRRGVEKAAAYLGMAVAARGAADPDSVARQLEAVPLAELFREAWARVVELQTRARAIRQNGWASAHPRAAELLDSPVRERLLALVEPRPCYVAFDAADRKPVLRDFLSARELEETRVAVELAEVVGDLIVRRLGLDVQQFLLSAGPVTVRFSNLWLTLLAWHSVRGELRGDPLPAEVVSAFLGAVASRRSAPAQAAPAAMGALVDGACVRFELDPRERSVLEAFGRFCLEQLDAACGPLGPEARSRDGRVGPLIAE